MINPGTIDTLKMSQYDVSPEMIQKAMDGDFATLLNEKFSESGSMEGTIVKGIVARVNNDTATIDIGMKAEGTIPLSEFGLEDGEKLKVGDAVDVYVDSLDDINGEARLSREKARREAALDYLEKAHADNQPVKGVMFGKVKGGFTVDLQGVLAFLPGSQVDVRPIKDVSFLMNTLQDFMIVKLDRKRSNLIVSRRAVMDESRSEARDELLEGMHEGKVLDGVVKNITDYGAFIDLGGIDGLLHITDLAWHRINHPSEVISLGQTIKVKVIRFDEETKRVSLGMKQLHDDPWSKVDDLFPIGKKVKGTVTNITEYGAFVELAPGIEGLIHVSEMSWTRKNVHPGKVISTSQEVDVLVLEIDRDKRRISLGLKQAQDNPWSAFAKASPEGSDVEGTVRSITDFGLFIGLTEELDGLVHMSDISWDKSGEEALRDFKKGDTVKARVLGIDAEKERISLGIKQLSEDPYGDMGDTFKKGDKVTATVVAAEADGLKVELEGGMPGFIKTMDLARAKAECDTNRFKEGEELEAQVLSISRKDRRVQLSVKALQIAEEKAAVAEYTQTEQGTGTRNRIIRMGNQY